MCKKLAQPTGSSSDEVLLGLELVVGLLVVEVERLLVGVEVGDLWVVGRLGLDEVPLVEEGSLLVVVAIISRALKLACC